MSRSEAPLVLELRASRGFRLGLAAVALAALHAIVLSDLPLSIAAVLGVAAVLLAARAWRRQAGLDGMRLRLSAAGDLDWRDAAGAEGQGRLVHHASIGLLVALAVRGGARGDRRFAIWRDMLDADAWRRLQVALARAPSADSYNDRA